MTNNCFRQELLDTAKIMVVGCGALGNEVLKNLALMKVGNIVVVDFDNVEAENLQRSVLFSEIENSVGRPKVDVAAEAIKKINPETNLKVINGDISADVGLGLIREIDVVIGCVDNRWARYCINRVCMRAGVPWIDGGISELEGSVKIFEPGKNCYACSLSNEDLNEMRKRFSCVGNIRRALQTGSAPTTPLIASVIGSVQVQEALKLIHNKYAQDNKFETLSGKMFFYDGKHLTSATVDFQAFDDDCPHHEKWEPIKEFLFTNNNKASFVLEILRQNSGSNVVVSLINDKFVESVIDKETDEEYPVNLPARFIERFITNDPSLNKKPLSSYYQKEVAEIHRDSPQSELTLKQLGIPEREVLKVREMRGKEYYIGIR